MRMTFSIALLYCLRAVFAFGLVITVTALLLGGFSIAILGLPMELENPAGIRQWSAVSMVILFPMLALAPLLEWWVKQWYNLDRWLRSYIHHSEA